MLIHKDALAVNEIATDEWTNRYFLDGALFDKQGRAVATNGNVLVRFTSRTVDAADFPPIDGLSDVSVADDVILASGDLRAARATMKKNNHHLAALDYLAIVPNGDHVTLATSDLSHQVQIRARKIEGTFPTYEKIFNVANPVIAKVCLAPDLLEMLVRIVRKCGGKSIHFTIHGEAGEQSFNQVLFTAKCENGDIDGAIMPMR